MKKTTFMGLSFNDSLDNVLAAFDDFLWDYLEEEIEKELLNGDFSDPPVKGSAA